MDKILATIPEASAAGGWGRSTTYQLLAEGKLESVKVGKRRLIVVESVHAFVASLRIKENNNGRHGLADDMHGDSND